MRIRIKYNFYTDGDYSLRDYNNFGCTDQKVEIGGKYFDYIGVASFDDDDVWICKHDAEKFLTQLLCDGIHISYTHYWLMEYFYNIIESLRDFIYINDSGKICKSLSGNYEGTMLQVEFIE